MLSLLNVNCVGQHINMSEENNLAILPGSMETCYGYRSPEYDTSLVRDFQGIEDSDVGGQHSTKVLRRAGFTTPDEVRTNPKYKTPDVESRAERIRRLARRRSAKRRLLRPLFSMSDNTIMEECGTSFGGSTELDASGTVASCIMEVPVTPHVTNAVSTMGSGGPSTTRLSSAIGMLTPEQVRNNPSYKTPEVESKSQKKRRLARRRQAKKKVLESLFRVEEGELTSENARRDISERSSVEATNIQTQRNLGDVYEVQSGGHSTMTSLTPIGLVTPEQVRTHPSYKTPNEESRAERKKRLA